MALPEALTTPVLKAHAALTRENLLAKQSFTRFCRLAVKDEDGHPVQLAPMHLAWHAHVDYCWRRGLKAMVQAHFGSGKSVSLAVPIVSWLVGNNPQIRAKIVCNDDSNAALRVGAVKQILESARYRGIFPGVRPAAPWSNHKLFVARSGFSPEPTVHARGVFTTGIGGRADVIVFDDVVDQKNSAEFAQRRRVRGLVEQTWLSRLEPGTGLVLWIATPWHLDDATHALMQTPGWCCLRQSVSEDCSRIEQEVIGGGDDYLACMTAFLGRNAPVLIVRS